MRNHFAGARFAKTEPGMLHRQGRPKLENAVLTFSDLDLRTRLVEMQAASYVSGNATKPRA